jgi:hypothetical protein
MLVCRRRRDSLIRRTCVSRRDTSRICAGCRDISSSSRTSDPIRRRGINNRRTGGQRAVTSRTRGVVWTPELCMRRAMFPGPRAGTFQCPLTGRACNNSSNSSSISNSSCSSSNSSGRRVRRLIIRSITIRRCSCRCRYPLWCFQHTPVCVYYRAREIREGWPLLTVETEVNGDSKSTNERGPWARRFFLSSFEALVGLVQNIFSLTVHYFHSFVPNAQQAGQAAVLGSLISNYVSLYRAFIFRAPPLLTLRTVPGTDAVLCGNGPCMMYL